MDWLNYHHLLYFWTVAKEGSLAAAAKQLHLAQPTLSTQIHTLERSLGVELFERIGRRLQLTEIGRIVFQYADDIFTIGKEMMDTVRGRPIGAPLRLQVGIVDVVPKLIAHRLLVPALSVDAIRLICYEGKLDHLLAQLTLHELDIVISDAPIPTSISIKGFNHLLGECGVTVFAAKGLARKLRRSFPTSLDGAPWLLPTPNNSLRRALDRWFETSRIRPIIAGEFEDSALTKVFGQQGLGCFAGPTAIEREICKQYEVGVIGRIEAIREQFFAITMKRKIDHPAVIALAKSARQVLLEFN
ncbi:MAG: transcriptional activator NhaR [Phycisphaerae bacterium]|nr:transcriptional activator NhaR [Phycisphaerae bacterium]